MGKDSPALRLRRTDNRKLPSITLDPVSVLSKMAPLATCDCFILEMCQATKELDFNSLTWLVTTVLKRAALKHLTTVCLIPMTHSV